MMTFPIYGKIKFMFQTTNQKYIMDQPSINNQPSFIGGEPTSRCFKKMMDFDGF